MQRGSKTQGRRLEASEKKALVLEYRRARHTYAEISQKTGVSVSRAQCIVSEYMRAYHEQNQANIAHVITTELAALDRLQQGVWILACKGNSAAIKRVLQIMERRAKLLGLDKGKEVDPGDKEVRIHGGLPDENVVDAEFKDVPPDPTPNVPAIIDPKPQE